MPLVPTVWHKAVQARAVLRPAPTANARPAAMTVRADTESVRILGGLTACVTTCRIAQDSAPKMESTHWGGTPFADARTVPTASKATNAQPVLLSRAVGPSRQEPSV